MNSTNEREVLHLVPNLGPFCRAVLTGKRDIWKAEILHTNEVTTIRHFISIPSFLLAATVALVENFAENWRGCCLTSKPEGVNRCILIIDSDTSNLQFEISAEMYPQVLIAIVSKSLNWSF